ncbi:MAG: hypothetical protein K0S65_4133, partial [Labilithrix sp.]|nr:hypothetical protein [Labilithrix sp.]
MGLLRWQWTLANRGVITAVIDTERGVERVTQDGRVLAEGARRAQLEGHTVLVAPVNVAERSERPPIEAVVTFDPYAAVCILRVDGHEIAPTAWPVKERPAPPPPVPSRTPKVLLASFIGAVVLTAALAVARRSDTAPRATADAALHGTHRARNGLFIAHFPDELEVKPAVLPSSAGGVVLENKARTLVIVLAALAAEPSSAAPLDPWDLQRRLREEVLANIPKGAARFEEATRRDETCAGERGAVVTGHLVQDRSQRARVWSCAFVHDGAG